MRSILTLTLLLPAFVASTQTVYTVQDGNWTDAATWDCSCVPGSSQSLVIMHNVEVMGSLTLDQPQVQVTSTGNINMSFPDQVFINTTFIMEGHVFFQGSVTINGLVDVTGFFEMAGVLVNNGQIAMDGGWMIIEGDLLNYQTIGGDGGICVYLITNNSGSINGTVDVCDFSPTTTIPPILDINSGTVAGTVTYCTNSICAAMGIPDASAVDGIAVAPNPVHDQLVISGLPASAPSLRVVDALGNMVRTCSPGDPIDVLGLAPGCYALVVEAPWGSRAIRFMVE